MESPLDGEQLKARFKQSESIHEFLDTVSEDVSGDIDTVFTHESEGEGTVTIVGGVHGGKQTRKGVKRVIHNREPEHIAVELGPVQYRLVQILKPPSTTLELATALFEAESVGAETHPIDRSQMWIRGKELRYGPRPKQIVAIIELLKRVAVCVFVGLAIALLAAGHGVIGLVTLAVAAIGGWWLLDQYRDDPSREYDYALIAIITSVADQRDDAAFQNRVTSQRDAHMAEELKCLREDGDVVAVVGYNHVEGIRNRIDDDADNWETVGFDLA